MIESHRSHDPRGLSRSRRGTVADQDARSQGFTNRESKIILLMRQGRTLKEVAAVLGISLAVPRSDLDPRRSSMRASRPKDPSPAVDRPLEFALTPRQLQILELIAIGATDKELARRLGMSSSTVHTHVDRMFRRFDVRSRSALVALWLTNRN